LKLLKKTVKTNPSSTQFGRIKPVPLGTLRRAKKEKRALRNFKRVRDAKINPDKYPIEMGVCWMCWDDLTGQDIQKWRKLPFSTVETHDETCPLCGYSRWKGRVWYPFKFLRNYIGNPSSRDFGKERE